MKIIILCMAGLCFSTVVFAQSNPLKTPDISANALFLYRNSNFAKQETDTTRNGLDIQEAEIAFYSNVDPYSRLNILLTVHPQYTLNTSTNKIEEKWVVEPEELFAESDIISGTTFKLGKFKAAFGKHNLLHTHAYPFVDAPIANSTLLGDEGLNDVGVSAATMIPVSWYSEITLQYLRGEGENSEFNSGDPNNDGVGVLHFKNLFDTNEALTTEFGLSYAQGRNALGGSTLLTGADLTWKWRPNSGGRYHSGILGLEYINRVLEQPGNSREKGDGLTGFVQYQFAERWAGLARSEILKVVDSAATNPNVLPNDTTEKNSLALVFTATEFSAFRIEYSQSHGPEKNNESNEKKIYLQANFTIGSHPAHAY